MRIILFCSILFFLSCSTENDQRLHEEIDLSWELITNLDPGGSKARFTLYNSGNEVLDGKNWALYFNQANVIPKPQNSAIGEVKHINGDFFCLLPGADFAINPGDSLQITYFYDGPMIKKTDAPMGLYWVYNEDSESEEFAIAENFKVIGFDRPEQIQRASSDHVPIPTADFLFEQNKGLSDMDLEGKSKIIPSPYESTVSKEYLSYDRTLLIGFDPEFEKEASYLMNRINSHFAHGSKAVKSEKADINLVRKKAKYHSSGDESYDLRIKQDGIEIIADQGSGVFYGIQSLLALQKEPLSADKLHEVSYPVSEISDKPRFGYRGFQLDVGRNFQDKETVKKLIDILATYKINTFLFYFTEDEGWRLEIEGLPELTEVGAQREHASMEDPALHPAYGSGPVAYASGTYGSGYYTKKEFIEILKYANERHIQVIPEVNLPGHARAAIKAMEMRYLRRPAGSRFRLVFWRSP